MLNGVRVIYLFSRLSILSISGLSFIFCDDEKDASVSSIIHSQIKAVLITKNIYLI